MLFTLLLLKSQKLELIPNIEETIKNLEKKETDEQKLKNGKLNFLILFSDDQKTEFENYNFKVFYSKDKKLAEKLNINFPGILAYNKDESIIYRLPLNENINSKQIINTILTPIYQPITSQNISLYESSGLPVFYLIDKKFNNEFYDCALNFKNVLKVGFLEFNENRLRQFKIEENQLPVCIGLHERKKYKCINVDNKKLTNFFNEFLNDKLEPFFLSQPEPKQKGDILILTRNNYKKYVDNTIILFHSPFCGYCIQLKPVYEKLAKIVNKYTKLKIGMMDMSQNDVPELNINAYPTIKFKEEIYAKNNEIEGSRTLEDFIKWVSILSGVDVKKRMSAKEREEL